MSTVKVVERVDPREIRRKLGLNQQQFWSKIGVTQSGGSRYESGRNMPKPVRELLRLVHVEQIDIQRLKREDFEVVEYLKAEDPEQFKSLKKAARGKGKKATDKAKLKRDPARCDGETPVGVDLARADHCDLIARVQPCRDAVQRRCGAVENGDVGQFQRRCGLHVLGGLDIDIGHTRHGRLLCTKTDSARPIGARHDRRVRTPDCSTTDKATQSY